MILLLSRVYQVLTAQGVRNLPERLMDTGVIPNAVVAYALGRVGTFPKPPIQVPHPLTDV
jgi:hypothetical protein